MIRVLLIASLPAMILTIAVLSRRPVELSRRDRALLRAEVEVVQPDRPLRLARA